VSLTEASCCNTVRVCCQLALCILMVLLSGCAQPQDYLTEDKRIVALESIERNRAIDPLVGLWESSYAGIRVQVGVDTVGGTPRALRAVVMNGSEVGFGFYDGHPWFQVDYISHDGVYAGKSCYQNVWRVESWFPNTIEMTSSDEFILKDQIPSTYLVVERAPHVFLRVGSARATRTPKTPPTYPPANSSPEIVKGTGTAFAVSADGTIVTAFHVVSNAASIRVSISPDISVPASLLRADPMNDLAVLKVSSKTPNFLCIAPIRSAKMGDKCFTIGFPVTSLLGREAKYSEGVVSATTGINDASSLLQITVPIQPGNSGGPLVNEKGQVIGIITSSAAVAHFLKKTGTLPQSVSWAVKSDYLRPLMELPEPDAQGASRAQLIEGVRQATFFVEVEKVSP
jgi:S1-C subfamily serine protease